MKKATWMPAAIAFGVQTTIVLAAVFTHGSRYVLSCSLGISVSTLGFLFLAYFVHFIGQQDFINWGCRPYAMSILGSVLLLLGIMMLMGSADSIMFSAFELFGRSGFVPTLLWFV